MSSKETTLGVPKDLFNAAITIGKHSGRYANLRVYRQNAATNTMWYVFQWGTITTRPMTESQARRLMHRMVRGLSDTASAFGSFQASTHVPKEKDTD